MNVFHLAYTLDELIGLSKDVWDCGSDKERLRSAQFALDIISVATDIFEVSRDQSEFATQHQIDSLTARH